MKHFFEQFLFQYKNLKALTLWYKNQLWINSNGNRKRNVQMNVKQSAACDIVTIWTSIFVQFQEMRYDEFIGSVVAIFRTRI